MQHRDMRNDITFYFFFDFSNKIKFSTMKIKIYVLHERNDAFLPSNSEKYLLFALY